IHAGPQTRLYQRGSVSTLELDRGPFRFTVDGQLSHDVFLWRHRKIATKALQDFGASLIHVTGPSDVGQLGVYLALTLEIPLVMSWHTNVQDFAERRVRQLLAALPRPLTKQISSFSNEQVMKKVLWFYRLGAVLLAPNQELVDLLIRYTG